MGIFRRKSAPIEAPEPEKRAKYYAPSGRYGGLTYSGRYVTTEEALRDAAVSACIRVLKTSAFMLPVDEYVKNGRSRQLVPSSPIVELPSGRVSQRAWVAQVLHSMLTNGNAYLDLQVPNALTGAVRNAETVDPDAVRWSTRDGVEVAYVNNVERTLWPSGDLLHKPASAFIRPGCVVADSPVELARQAIGTALAAEEFGARFFGDGGHPSALLYVDEELDQPAADAIKGAFINAQAGREPAVFGSGIKYQQIQIDPTDSQFIDLLRFEVEQACRFFGVPPTMVYAAVSGQSITYANVSEAEMQYLKFSLLPWLIDIEDMWTSLIARPHFVKFNADALLRMDPAGRHKLYDLRLRNKTMTVNEVRALEDEERINDAKFDEPGLPNAERALSAVEAVQKVYLGVGTVLTADEARELINDAGADLPIPGPDLTPTPSAPPPAPQGNA